MTKGLGISRQANTPKHLLYTQVLFNLEGCGLGNNSFIYLNEQ